jgi:hypothetical protein
MATMLDDKDTAYVARWPHAIADRVGISVEHVARALERVTGQKVSQMAFYADQAVPEIGALTTEQARAVVAQMQAIRQEIESRQDITHCRTCGLPLRDGECQECQ